MAFGKVEESYEGWKKEYEKLQLSKKYARCTEILEEAKTYPDINNVIRLYASLDSFLTMIPIIDDKNEEVRKAWYDILDEIEVIIHGEKGAYRSRLMKKYRVSERTGVSYNSFQSSQIVNLNNIIRELRNVLREAGTFTAKLGLRLTLKATKKIGYRAILEKEGFIERE